MKDATLDRLRALIEREDDVETLHKLVRVNDERALYLIETPFESYPRFVVGLTDLGNKDPQVIERCNKRENAEAAFDEARLEHGLPPAD